MKRKKVIIVLVVVLILLSLLIIWKKYQGKDTEDAKVQAVMDQIGLSINDIEIPLEDTKNAQRQVLGSYLLINDLHVISTTEDTTEEFWDTINQRRESWAITGKGVHSADTWQGIASIVDAMNVDGLLLAGDMVDFGSSDNYQTLQKGLSQISTPIMYARADHDMATWYNSDGSYTKEDVKAAQETLKGAGDNMTPMEDMMVWDKGEYCIMGWNNSTSQLSEAGLAKAKETFALGKPIILMTHVPINSPVDEGLSRAARDFDPEHRAKLWGQGCLYEPNETTEEFLRMVLDEDSPVQAVLCGHLHFAYDVQLNEHCTEHVFNPSFTGSMTRVTIVK